MIAQIICNHVYNSNVGVVRPSDPDLAAAAEILAIFPPLPSGVVEMKEAAEALVKGIASPLTTDELTALYRLRAAIAAVPMGGC